ncbi:MAG TPA: hemolysin family protein [Acidimicrobiales bacterium]|nr:hemolysin family protein [Acidimicrobiales bacterium]
MSTTLAIGLTVTLGFIAAVLAIAETSLTRIGAARASVLEEEGHPRADALVRLLERRDQALNPILFVIVCCHLGVAAVVAIWADERYSRVGVVVALAVVAVVLFVLAEAVPKTYALMRPDSAALAIVPIATFLSRVPPLRWGVRALVGVSNVLLPGQGRSQGPAVSEGDLLAFAVAAADAEVIEVEERQFIESIIEFGDTIVREVMVPRPDMVTVMADFLIGPVMEVAIINGLSRLPVCGDGIDDVVGIAYAKDLMKAERDGTGDDPVTEHLRAAQFVPESKRVAELLREMQAEQFHMAIVVDEYGGTAGLVTLEDLIEELVGEIVDEFDVAEALVSPLAGGGFEIDARVPVDEVNDITGAELPEGDDWDSIGGLMFMALGHVPVEGESIEVEGVELIAARIKGRRIGRIQVRRVAP